MSIFSRKPDPEKMAEQKRIKFREFEEIGELIGDKEIANNAKATWLVDRGIFYAKKKMFDEAFKDYDEAISLQPDHIPAHYSRAKLHKRMGNHDEAYKLLEKMPEEMKLNGKVIATKKDTLNQYGF
jgi:tetratricopeptide (TPR) repeat protein